MENAVTLWCRVNGVSRAHLAHLLGVTPELVARWERGQDEPTGALRLRLRDVISPFGKQSYLQRQTDIRTRSDVAALFDLDGVRLLAVSQGLGAAWPEFAGLVGYSMNDHLVSTARTLLHDPEFVRAARQGQIATVTGVSDEHAAIGNDPRFRHRWAASVRPYGDRVILEMGFYPCEPTRPLGLERLISVHDL